MSAAEFDLASDLGFRLRRLGVTVPATDLIIAASALRAGATLYHLDAHFDAIAEHSELRSHQLGPARSIESPSPPPVEPDPTAG